MQIFDVYLHNKINFILHFVHKILHFKNPEISLAGTVGPNIPI